MGRLIQDPNSVPAIECDIIAICQKKATLGEQLSEMCIQVAMMECDGLRPGLRGKIEYYVEHWLRAVEANR